MHLKRIQILAILLMGILSGQMLGADADGHDSLLFGISPHFSKEQQALWQPLLRYIEKQTNYPLHLEASSSIPVFENRLFSGKFDLAYINPKLYIEANRYVGYQPVVKEGQKKLQGIIVVTKDSMYKTLKDLKGLRFVSPENNFAASVVTRLNLYAQGVDFVNSLVKTSAQTYADLMAGSADAVGAVQQTFDSISPEIKNKLRILWVSQGVTPYAFVINPRVNTVVKQRMVDAILSFKDTPEGATFFKDLQINPFVAAKNKDWNDMRQLIGE